MVDLVPHHRVALASGVGGAHCENQASLPGHLQELQHLEGERKNKVRSSSLETRDINTACQELDNLRRVMLSGCDTLPFCPSHCLVGNNSEESLWLCMASQGWGAPGPARDETDLSWTYPSSHELDNPSPAGFDTGPSQTSSSM